MARRRKRAVERYHDRVAHRYEHSYEDAYWKWHDSLTWDHIRPYLPADQQAPVLDLGCGAGKWAAKLAKSGYRVTCVDISRSMLETAQRTLEHEGGGVSSFIQADLGDLSSLPENYFALAIALGEPIGSTASPARALKEIRRVLTPDGSLMASFDNRLNAIDLHLQAGDPRALYDFLRKGRTHWLTRDREERFELFTYTPAQLRKLVVGAGYEVVDLIGKTVLPMRHYRGLLEDPPMRRRWMRIEKSLWRDEAAMGRAAHLQIVAKRAPA